MNLISNLMEQFYETLGCCQSLEGTDKVEALLYEIGVLRGLSFSLHMVGICPDAEAMNHFIELQGELLGYTLL